MAGGEYFVAFIGTLPFIVLGVGIDDMFIILGGELRLCFYRKICSGPCQTSVVELFWKIINPFLANVPILYPLKIQENQRFSNVFRGYKMGTLARIGLTAFSY